MSVKRKTVISIETHRLTVIRSRRPALLAWCERCDKEVLMLKPDAAAALAGVSPCAIYRRVENGELHFVETGAGPLLICTGSL